MLTHRIPTAFRDGVHIYRQPPSGQSQVYRVTQLRTDGLQPRALSLRNLVSGFECGMVFPAGVGPGSPSRDAANWLSSRFSRSAETRRRYGWLRMVFPGARLLRAPIWCPSGGGGTREAGSTVAESLVTLYRVGTHQIRRGRRVARSSTSQESAKPMCVRIKGANREVS